MMGPWGYYPSDGMEVAMNPAQVTASDRTVLADPPVQPQGAIGRSPDSRCVALPDLASGTVTTIKDSGSQLIIGTWRIVGQRPGPAGGLAVTVQLPFSIALTKANGRCRARQSGLTLTFTGRNLREVLNEAATTWCRTV